jgi:hypothetical protein
MLGEGGIRAKVLGPQEGGAVLRDCHRRGRVRLLLTKPPEPDGKLGGIFKRLARRCDVLGLYSSAAAFLGMSRLRFTVLR